jgi:hypothetical protein
LNKNLLLTVALRNFEFSYPEIHFTKKVLFGREKLTRFVALRKRRNVGRNVAKINKNMNFSRKEIYWLIGTILFILIFNFTILGIDSLSGGTIDINVHDTLLNLVQTRFCYGHYVIFRELHLNCEQLNERITQRRILWPD